MEWEFVKLNWHLFLALAAVIALLVLEPLRSRSSGVKSVSAVDLPRVMSREKGIVVDISDPKDFKNGHIPKARNIPLNSVESDIGRMSKFKSRPIIVACRAGNRSARAAKVFRKHDFTDVRTLQGGFAAWSKENLPIEKG